MNNTVPASPAGSKAVTPAIMLETRPLYWSVQREVWEHRSIYPGGWEFRNQQRVQRIVLLPSCNFDENEPNSLGYEHIHAKKVQRALLRAPVSQARPESNASGQECPLYTSDVKVKGSGRGGRSTPSLCR